MAESYEVVLQEVPVKGLFALLKELEGISERVGDLVVSEGLEGSRCEGGFCENLVNAFSSYEGSVCMAEKLFRFRVSKDDFLSSVLLRVVKYEGRVDVEMSFDSFIDLDVGFVMLAFQEISNALSRRFHVKDCYGGLEPAVDVDTRYFTNGLLGPLSLRKNKLDS
ncbi:hypothetical protein NNO07_00005 [Pseudomonas resinovorans]|uniref:Uncharacterized protein n=1 Tax=Metapseudomonas resinovorans TaxID=53412 RepID=A0ABT4XXX9_METRE|nr:hypothetical protein [Pseudomonas resinovorans]MDA8481432.1 hypothetical protein [Pseudomonas resinovorans]